MHFNLLHHLFRFEAGRGSDLMSSTLRRLWGSVG
jgi:hypothetical protein